MNLAFHLTGFNSLLSFSFYLKNYLKELAVTSQSRNRLDLSNKSRQQSISLAPASLGVFGRSLTTAEGNNRTGQGDGYDEAVKISLASVPSDISRIVFPVTIREWEANGQNFGQVQNASIRAANDASGAEIARYDLAEDSAVETAMVFGEVYRNGTDCELKAVGQGFKGGLAPLARSFGVNIG